MSKSSYWELLKHPKWQEKRLEIMQRAGFACEECGDKETTLNVHHGYYRKGADPWDYPSGSLHCLCEPCHEQAEALKARLYFQISMLQQPEIAMLLGVAQGLEMSLDPRIPRPAGSLDVLRGMMLVMLCNSQEVEDSAEWAKSVTVADDEIFYHGLLEHILCARELKTQYEEDDCLTAACTG